MAMKILIVEDGPSLSGLYKDALCREMPGARVDIVASFGGYMRIASETPYDAYIIGETIDGGKNAFEQIVPRILAKFPGAFVLHNSAQADPEHISQQERLYGIRFARGPDGRVITCRKQISVAIEAIRSMVVPRDEIRKMLPASGKMPICQSAGANQEPRIFFKCCRP